MKKLIFLASFIIFFVSTNSVNASEGRTILRNRIGTATRCEASSGLMENQSYNILFLCRDIIYPGGTDIFYYVAWATPSNGGSAVRLGDLGVGKELFKTKTAFSSLFVTKETTKTPRVPSNALVMQGSVQRYESLDNPSGVQPVEEGEPEFTPEPTPTPSRGLGQIGAVAGLGLLVAVIGFVFYITHKFSQ